MSDAHKRLTLLGGEGRSPISADQIECFPAPPGCSEVVLTNEGELTALCPKTGQPDYYDLEISYVPNALCIESKALKLYLQGFRDRGNFIETMAATICQDLSRICSPTAMLVTLRMKPRGGIAITARSFFPDTSTGA